MSPACANPWRPIRGKSSLVGPHMGGQFEKIWKMARGNPIIGQGAHIEEKSGTGQGSALMENGRFRQTYFQPLYRKEAQNNPFGGQ